MNRTAILSIILVALLAVVAGAVFALPQGAALRASLLGPGLEKVGSTSVAQAAGDGQGALTLSASPSPPPSFTLTGSSAGQEPLQGPSVSDGSESKDAAAAEDKDAAAKDEKAEEEEKTPQTDEEWIAKLDEWKTQDPREIIKAKYDDLEKRKTTPWNEDDPANFIPETGRVDPLSPVLSELPDELKQRRGMETDANEILSYAFSAAASEAVDTVMAVLQVYNVVQIGTEKLVTMGIPGDRAFTVSEGGGRGFNFPVQGMLVTVSVQVVAVSTEEVTVVVTGEVPGTDASITKNQIYIPRRY